MSVPVLEALRPAPAWPTLGRATAIVAAELGQRFTPEEIVDWLLTPHPLLGGRVPLGLLPGCLECCRQAARVDHFLRDG